MQVILKVLIIIGFVAKIDAQEYALDPKSAILPKELLSLKIDTAARYSVKEWYELSGQWQIEAIDKGYFLFSLKPSFQSDSTVFFQIYTGPYFDGIAMKRSGSDEVKWLNAKDLTKIVQDTLHVLLNSGYPFAQVGLNFSSGEQALFFLETVKGPKVQWGQFVIRPEGIIQEKVLRNLLQIYPGDVFEEEKLLQIQAQFEGQLPFKFLRAPEWAYTGAYADLYLYLERIKLSSATAIIGLQQNPVTQKNALVGEFNLNLQNSLQKNEQFLLHWRSIAPQTQMLKSSLTWPYIAGSAYGLNAGFTLYRRDSLFLEVKGNLGLTYLFANSWQVMAQLDFWRSNNLLSVVSNSQLENFNTLSYGIGLQRQQLDFLPNPSRGMQFKALYLVGNKKTDISQLAWRFELSQRYFIPLSKRHILSFRQEVNHIQSSTLFVNELYRFGGLERMRGFDEEAFFASTVVFAGLEYRFLLDQYAHFLVFSDWSWFENKVQNISRTGVYALGVGLVLGSDKGQFKLSYGLGTEIGNTLQLNAGKLHLGYISYF